MRRILLLLIICFSFTSIFAQTGDIRGFVYEKKTGEPIIFTNVYLRGSNLAAQTDINGFYSIPKVPVGSYILVCQYLGFDSINVNVTIEAGKINNQNLYLNKSTVNIKETVITGKKQEKKEEVKVSEIKVTPKEINVLPSVGGEADLAQYLQVLPGVIFTGDQGGQLYIRGGSPIQNKVLLDGMTLYNPFHTIGLFSVFETDIIRNANVLSGGFGAEYGGRISSVVDVTTRDGNKKELAGKVSISPFMSRLTLEGPLKKLKEEGGGAVSYLITSKYLYLDKSSKIFYPYVDSVNAIPYNFLDFYGKISMVGANGSKINFFGFNYNDRVNYPEAQYGWNTKGGGMNFILIPSQSKTVIRGLFAMSDYKAYFDKIDAKARTSGIGGFNGNIDFSYYFPKSELNFGFNVNGFATKFEFFNDLGIKLDQNQYTTEGGSFVLLKMRYGGLVIEPSFRLDYYASLSQISPEFRLRTKANITDKLRWKLGIGNYTQNFISTKSDREVVNLFNGFLSAPDIDLYNINGEISNSQLQHSFHGITGFEIDLSDFVELNLETYYKGFTQLIDLNRNKILPNDPDYMIETGKAYGFDVTCKYEYRNMYLWLVYSLGYNFRNSATQTYPPHYDRRHNANVVASYKFGKSQDWELSSRWNLGSGFPFTKTQGYYEYLNFNQGLISNPATSNGSIGIIYDETINGGRLPYYHRLDLSLSKNFALSPKSNLEINASVTNGYNRKNIFYFDRVNYRRVNQLPLLPAISANVSF